MNRIIPLSAAALFAVVLTGCGDKLIVATPSVTVNGVELVDRTDSGVRALVHLTLTNDGDVPLPLTNSHYTLTFGAAGSAEQYAGGTNPNATLPAKGTQTLTLPAAVAGSIPDGATYTLSGSITYEPPGQIRQVLTDIGFPLPSVSFSATGTAAGSPPIRPMLENTAPQAGAERSAAPGSAPAPGTPGSPGSGEDKPAPAPSTSSEEPAK